MTEAHPPAPPRILALWSAPRSRSTAFLRMMVERGDFLVLHEPFSHVVDFGATTVDGREVRSEPELIAAIRALAGKTPVFFKDTTDFAYPGLLADAAFLGDATHTFIIRDPADMLASYFALTPDLRLADVGIERLSRIYDRVCAVTGRDPVVVSSEDLVACPEQTVRAYCAAVGIPFLPGALSWRPDMLPEWRHTSRWHESTSRTNGFAAPSSAYRHTVANHPLLARYHAYHLPYYERLFSRRLRVPR